MGSRHLHAFPPTPSAQLSHPRHMSRSRSHVSCLFDHRILAGVYGYFRARHRFTRSGLAAVSQPSTVRLRSRVHPPLQSILRFILQSIPQKIPRKSSETARKIFPSAVGASRFHVKQCTAENHSRILSASACCASQRSKRNCRLRILSFRGLVNCAPNPSNRPFSANTETTSTGSHRRTCSKFNALCFRRAMVRSKCTSKISAFLFIAIMIPPPFNPPLSQFNLDFSPFAVKSFRSKKALLS